MLTSSIITTNRKSTITAPTYTSTSVIARNSAFSSIQTAAAWKKASTTVPARSYLPGFADQTLTLDGGLYTPPAVGATVLGLVPTAPATSQRVILGLSGAGLTPFSQYLHLGTTSTAFTLMPTAAGNPKTLTFTSFLRTTGTFTGTFKEGTGTAARTGTFYGHLLPDPVNAGKYLGYGHFLLPQSSLVTSPILSGIITLAPDATAISFTPSGTSLPGAVKNLAYSQQVTASDGAATFTYSVAAGSLLPTGLTLSASGLLSGVPTATAVGTKTLKIVATDSAASGRTETKQYTLVIAP